MKAKSWLMINSLQGLEKLVESTCKELKDELTDNIYEKFGTFIVPTSTHSVILIFRSGRRLRRR